MRRHLTRSLGLLAAGAASLAAAMPAPASAAVSCDRVVSATGDDAAAGTADAPFRTVGRALNAAASGQTVCLRGEVAGDVWVAKAGVTLTSEPGQRGRLLGQIVIDPAADHVTVADLDLNSRGVGRPSPIVLGDDATLVGNDITNEKTPIVCMILGALGHDSNATASRTRIEANRIHDCGTVNNHRHGMYLEHAEDTRIVGNRIYDNADRAIQLYPSAQRTLIAGNIIDGNGEGIIFSGEGASSSNGNVVRGNIITNPRLRAAVESYFPAGTPKGVGNEVTGNCVFGSVGTIDVSGGGFTAHDNVVADPGYVARDAKDFRLRPGSPCADILAGGLRELQVATAADVTDPSAAAVRPAAATPAPAPQPATTPAPAPAPPVVISVTPTADPAVVVVKVTLKKGAKPSRTRVEVRRGARWSAVGTARVTRTKGYVKRVRVTQRRKVAFRARLVTAKHRGRAKIVTFRRA